MSERCFRFRGLQGSHVPKLAAGRDVLDPRLVKAQAMKDSKASFNVHVPELLERADHVKVVEEALPLNEQRLMGNVQDLEVR